MRVESTSFRLSHIWEILASSTAHRPAQRRAGHFQFLTTMKTFPLILIGCTLAIGTWISYANLYRGVAFHSAGRQGYIHAPFDSSRIDSQIAVSEKAVKLDPGAAMGWSMLSSDYMARSRESDDLGTAVKAEAAARQSLKIRNLGNIGARNKLAQSLLQQHKFKDALNECDLAMKSGIFDDGTIRVKAECLIEIGRYSQAQEVIEKSSRAFKGASGKFVRARLLDIQGKPNLALALMSNAVKEVEDAPAMPSDAIAWFHTHLGIQLAKMGRHDDARTENLKALELYPRDYKAKAGLAKLAFQDGRWAEAIELGNSSDKIAQMADVRAMVGDAYAMLGDSTQAEEQYNRVATLVGRPSGMNDGLHEVAPAAGTHGHRLDRQYALFCADHNRDPEGAFAAAIRDFEGRQDLYAYDTLAWVCYYTGRTAEAKQAIEKALAFGTQDPQLLYHAGAIFAKSNDDARALQCVKEAIAIDSKFDGLSAKKAIELLRSLDQPVGNKK